MHRVTRSVSSQAGPSLESFHPPKIASAGIDEHNLAAVGDHHRRESPAAGGRPRYQAESNDDLHKYNKHSIFSLRKLKTGSRRAASVFGETGLFLGRKEKLERRSQEALKTKTQQVNMVSCG